MNDIDVNRAIARAFGLTDIDLGVQKGEINGSSVSCILVPVKKKSPYGKVFSILDYKDKDTVKAFVMRQSVPQTPEAENDGSEYTKIKTSLLYLQGCEYARLQQELADCQAQRRAAFRRIEELDRELQTLRTQKPA